MPCHCLAAGGIPFFPAVVSPPAANSLSVSDLPISINKNPTQLPQTSAAPTTTLKCKITENTWLWVITDTTVSLKIFLKCPQRCNQWPTMSFTHFVGELQWLFHKKNMFDRFIILFIDFVVYVFTIPGWLRAVFPWQQSHLMTSGNQCHLCHKKICGFQRRRRMGNENFFLHFFHTSKFFFSAFFSASFFFCWAIFLEWQICPIKVDVFVQLMNWLLLDWSRIAAVQ